MSARAWFAVVGAVLLAALLLGLFGSRATTDAKPSPRAIDEVVAEAIEGPPPQRPAEAPVMGRDEPSSLPHPTAPLDMSVVRREAYAAARAEGDPRPGEAAFRAMVSAFMRHNRQLAEQQAEAEGLTMDEVEELTFLGLMAQQTQRWPEVEEVVGAPIDADTRIRAEQFLDELNQGFKEEMRGLVASGASERERGRLIRRTQDRYREVYFELTGMNPDHLDDLLAGDGSRAHPPGELPPEEVLAQQPEAQPQPEPERPTGPAPTDDEPAGDDGAAERTAPEPPEPSPEEA
ncbi:MAG: hypothetical protein AAGH15_13060 [Myxococcota bacterium]